jgi:hypothetical protein
VPDLSADAPLPTRLLAWCKERFPPSHGALFFVLYATALLFGRFLAADGSLIVSPLRDGAGFLAAWAFFLMLRVFDEHKDYDLDLLNHPGRVLQSGRITLGHLKVLGAAAILLQAGVTVAFDGGWGPATAWWCVVMVWSSLMAKEFFVGAWLEERLVLYALSHMLVMPMALVWMAAMGATPAPLPAAVGGLALLSFLSGAAFEITRKTRGPEEEQDTIQSYSRVFGTRRAPLVIAGLLAASAGVQWGLLRLILPDGPGGGFLAALVAPVIFAAVALQRFRAAPSEAARERNEGAVSLAMLASYGVVLAALVVARGVALS